MSAVASATTIKPTMYFAWRGTELHITKVEDSHKRLNAGELRDRVVLKRHAYTQDDAGQPISSPTTVDTYWAKVENMSAAEGKRGDKLEATVTHKITMRNPTRSLRREALIIEAIEKVPA